jgi:hypothetical protein
LIQKRDPTRASSRNRALALVFSLLLPGCQATRLYAKDLLDPRASRSVSVPVDLAIGLFVLPPTILWLPISIAPLLLLHDEGAVWFALAPGLVLGGPFVLLAGAPGYALSDKPGSDAQVAPVSSPSRR